MEIDLDHILDATRKGQWSIHEFDWDTPLQGTGNLTEKQLREMALMIVFTAGLEYQAARIFDLCSKYVSDKRARQIYELFAIDEIRHAESELLMAKRYGVTWDDLPLPTKFMFRAMRSNFRNPSRLMHEFTSAQIILFEIGLDALLIPALKEIDDPLQKEVFRRIDVDESRHLAMDYWLLERKANGIDYEKQQPTLENWLRFGPMMLLAPIGFAATAMNAKFIQRKMASPDRQANYWNRIDSVTKRAPSAMNLAAYRNGVGMMRRLQKVMGRMVGTDRSVSASQTAPATA